MRMITKLALIAVSSLAFFGPASAAIITFDGLPAGTNFAPPYSEAGFVVSLTRGGLLQSFSSGGPAPSLEINLGSGAFGTVQVVRSGGGTFSLNSFDLLFGTTFPSGRATPTPFGYTIKGFLGIGTVFNESGTLGNGTVFGPSGDIDRLTFDIFLPVTSGFIYLDNIDLTPTIVATSGVPEPATWAVMLMGFGLIGATLRRTRRPAIQD